MKTSATLFIAIVGFIVGLSIEVDNAGAADSEPADAAVQSQVTDSSAGDSTPSEPFRLW